MWFRATRLEDEASVTVNLDQAEILMAKPNGCRVEIAGKEYWIDAPVDEVVVTIAGGKIWCPGSKDGRTPDKIIE